MNVELIFALQNNRLVSIEQVASGLECNCICPCCGGTLIARKGNSRKHHFAHYNVEDCKHGAESALHIMAKKIVAETKEVCVPNIPKSVYEIQTQKRYCKFDKSYIEYQLSPHIRSDVLLERDGRILNVEIKVSHSVDDFKKIHLFNEDIPTIEIDLSAMINDYSEKLVRHFIANGYTTSLLFSPKAKEIFAKRWLGEWKKVHRDRGGSRYVKNCYATGSDAYFIADHPLRNHGGRECHECCDFIDYNGGDLLLCREKLKNLDFKKIERIVDIRKDGDILKYAELVVCGRRYIYGYKTE